MLTRSQILNRLIELASWGDGNTAIDYVLEELSDAELAPAASALGEIFSTGTPGRPERGVGLAGAGRRLAGLRTPRRPARSPGRARAAS